MAPKKFGDIQKSALNTLSDDYNFDKKFKLTTKSANGVTFKAEGALKGGKAGGKVSTKFDIDGNVAVDNVSATHNGVFGAKATLKNLVDGLTLTFDVEDSFNSDLKDAKPKGVLDVVYKADAVTVQSKLNVVGGPTVHTMATTDYEGVTVGVEALVQTNLDTDSKAGPVLKDAGLALAYSGGDFTASARTLKKASAACLAVVQQVDKQTSVAGALTLDTKSGKPTKLEVGGRYKHDSETTFTGKVNHEGKVSANYIQQVRPQVKLVASVMVDATRVTSDDAHKFGLQLILG